MAFQGLTPESLLDRADSKNPATTCKGLTANGRPCRRGLGSTPGSSPNNTPTRRSSSNNKINSDDTDNGGVVAIIDSSNAAAFFCWQHKDQAQNLIARIESQQLQQQQAQQQAGIQRQKTRIIPLQKRSSIDTLIEKVGIIDLDGDGSSQYEQSGHGHSRPRQRPRDRSDNVRTRKRDTLPVEWQGIQGPLMSVPEEVVHEVDPDPRIQRRRSRSRSRTILSPRESRQEKLESSNVRVRPKQKSSWNCCGLVDDGYNDDGPPVRRRERYDERRASRNQSRPRPSMSNSRPVSYSDNATSRSTSQPAMQERYQRTSQIYNPDQQRRPNHSIQVQTPTRQRAATAPNAPPQMHSSTITSSSSTSPPHTQTSHFLSLIPPHLDPTTTSALLTELSKPFAKDDDAGYIYIYWLTPSNGPTDTNDIEDKPDDDIASTILDSDSDSDSDSDDSYNPTTTRSRHRSQLPNLSSSSQRRNHGQSQKKQTKQALLSRYASIKQPSLTTSTSPSQSTPTPTPPPKILLKIGRATNVHRRMTQWSKQCNQNITLIRYYPYKSTSSTHTPSRTPYKGDIPGATDKVPHVNKVERLIHIELRGLGMGYDYDSAGKGKKCEVCGRGHREWFEVEGTRAGLKMVDGVVRRWVGWGVTVDVEQEGRGR